MLGQVQDDPLDSGPRKGGSATARFCVVTGEVKPVDQMIRFVLGPDGAAVPDLRRRLPGRGIWITATRQALGVAIARKAFTRGFKRDVRLAPDFLDMTERLIERAALDALAIVHKAGTAAIGFANVDAALTRARVVALLNAAEAAPHGRRKLLSALHQREDSAEIAVIDGFSSAQLDLAFGRSNVIHAALLAGPESETFLARAARLDGFRAGLTPGLPGNGEHQVRKSARAGLRHEGKT
ncbi:MAG: RNA-binding protein [Xanthobacteraceae bacterium]|jgi:predicted RNA-binding protein YlxR (DUF448 family)